MFVTSMFAAFKTICSKASSLLGRARTKSCATLLQKNICSPSATAAPTPCRVESKDAVLLTFLQNMLQLDFVTFSLSQKKYKMKTSLSIKSIYDSDYENIISA